MNKQWKITSLDKSCHGVIKLEDGRLSYKVVKNEETLLAWSQLGLITSYGIFDHNLIFQDSSTTELEEEFPLWTGKRAIYRNDYRQLTLHFTNKKDQKMRVIFRAYHDGIAYRYHLEHQESFSVLDEKGTFVMPAEVKRSFAMRYMTYYEGFYRERKKFLRGHFGMPLLYQLESGTYGLIAQAELKSTYNGRMIYGDGTSTYRLKSVYKRTDNNKRALKEVDHPIVPADFKSPWRVLIVGQEKDIFNTEIVEALNPPLAMESTDWIKPGTTGWSWWSGDATDDLEVYKNYVDYCSAMDYPYLLLDDGWEKMLEKKEYATLSKYADEKEIGLIVWSDQKDLDTDEKLKKLEVWKDLGVKGIKVDFFNNEEQKRIKVYDDILKKAQELKLLVNYHGSNPPSGIRRTYPHLVTAEGIRGAEYTKMLVDPNPSAKHNCTVPFTRNVVGPMDFTPVTYTTTGRKYTYAHSTALPVVFESGMTCIADRPWQILSSHATQFLKGMPSVWDESLMLEASVGQYITVARQSNDTWYIGSICNKKRTANLDFHFLNQGIYMAEIIEDESKGYHLKHQLRRVTRNTALSIPLRQHGGVAIKLTKLSHHEQGKKLAWKVVRRDENFVPLGVYEGVKINKTAPGLLGSKKCPLKNLALAPLEVEDFDLSVKLYFEPTKKGQKAGLLIYGDEEHYFTVEKAYDPKYSGKSFIMSSKTNQGLEEKGLSNKGHHINYLRIKKVGHTVEGYWSHNGVTWEPITQFQDIHFNKSLKIGLYATDGPKKFFKSPKRVVFSDLTLDGEKVLMKY